MQPGTSSRKRSATQRSNSHNSYLSGCDNKHPQAAIRVVQLATYDEDSLSNSSGFSEDSASSNLSYFSNIPFIDKSFEDQNLNESQNTITEAFKQSKSIQKSVSLESMNQQVGLSSEECNSEDTQECDISQYLFSTSSSFHSFLSSENNNQQEPNQYKVKSFPRSKSENHFHERQRECIYQELVSTEKTYCNGLWTLIDFIAQQFKATTLISPKDLCIIFPSILPRLYSIHAELLARLEYRKLTMIPPLNTSDMDQSSHRSRSISVSKSISKIKRGASKSPSLRQRKSKPGHICKDEESLEENSSFNDPLNVAGILLETFGRNNEEFFSVYRQYFHDFSKAIAVFGKYMKRSQSFRRFIKKLQNHPRCANLDLTAYLVTPVQRLPRYLLLVKQLTNYTPADHPDKCVLKAAQKRLHEFLDEINSNIDCNLHNDRKVSCSSVCPSSPSHNGSDLSTCVLSSQSPDEQSTVPSSGRKSTCSGESGNDRNSSPSAPATPVTIRYGEKSGCSRFRLLSWFLSRHQRQDYRCQSDEENSEHFINQRRSSDSPAHSQSTFTIYNHDKSSASSMTNLSHTTQWSSATTIQSAKRSLKNGEDSIKSSSSVKDISKRFKDVKASVKSCKRKRQKRASSTEAINKDCSAEHRPSVNRHPSLGALIHKDPFSGENSQQMSPAINRKTFEDECTVHHSLYQSSSPQHCAKYNLTPLENLDANLFCPYEQNYCSLYNTNTHRVSATDSGYNGCAPSFTSSVRMNFNCSLQLTWGTINGPQTNSRRNIKRKQSKSCQQPEPDEIWCKSPQSRQRVLLNSQRSFTARYEAASSASTEHSNSTGNSTDYSALRSSLSHFPAGEKEDSNNRQSRPSIRYHKSKTSGTKSVVTRSSSQGHNLKEMYTSCTSSKETDEVLKSQNESNSLSKSFKKMFSVKRSKTAESLRTNKSNQNDRVLHSKTKYIVLS